MNENQITKPFEIIIISGTCIKSDKGINFELCMKSTV